jgi:hypothetical protein
MQSGGSVVEWKLWQKLGFSIGYTGSNKKCTKTSKKTFLKKDHKFLMISPIFMSPNVPQNMSNDVYT